MSDEEKILKMLRIYLDDLEKAYHLDITWNTVESKALQKKLRF